MYNRHHDRTGNASMTSTRISEYERWPHAGERPSIRFLLGLAAIFGTTIDQILDADDWTAVPEDDHLIISRLVNGPTVPIIADLPTRTGSALT